MRQNATLRCYQHLMINLLIICWEIKIQEIFKIQNTAHCRKKMMRIEENNKELSLSKEGLKHKREKL